MEGNLYGNASPRIAVELYGMSGRSRPPVLFDAIVDTGFTGGVSIPVSKSFPLGLILHGIATFTLADNSEESAFLCLGTARMEDEEKLMIFSLTKGNDILVGTEFLASFNAKFELDYKMKKFTLIPQKPTAQEKVEPITADPL